MVLVWGLLTLTSANRAASLDLNQAPESKLPPYTGIVKNNTGYTLTVPSLNSDATLTIPPRGFVEYTAWTSKFDLDAYRNGKAIWCDHISVNPEQYSYMCKKYDFVAEITAPEPVQPVKKHKSKLKKRKVKRQKVC